jgi:hypothetical protein
MPCDSSFYRRLRVKLSAVAIIAFATCTGVLAGAPSAQARAPAVSANVVPLSGIVLAQVPAKRSALLLAQAGEPATSAAPASATADPSAPSDASAGAPASDVGATDAGAATGDGSAPAEPTADTRGLDEEIQNLKKDVVDLNKDLFVLEEELLFPANTQVAIFVSMDVGDFFALDNVTLKIDQKEVANYLYTPREAEALLKGGVQRLYLGNLKVGEHELVAFFNGKGPNERDYRRGATLKFEKGIGAKYLELKINDRQRKQQPEFEIKDWE